MSKYTSASAPGYSMETSFGASDGDGDCDCDDDEDDLMVSFPEGPRKRTFSKKSRPQDRSSSGPTSSFSAPSKAVTFAVEYENDDDDHDNDDHDEDDSRRSESEQEHEHSSQSEASGEIPGMSSPGPCKPSRVFKRRALAHGRRDGLNVDDKCHPLVGSSSRNRNLKSEHRRIASVDSTTSTSRGISLPLSLRVMDSMAMESSRTLVTTSVTSEEMSSTMTSSQRGHALSQGSESTHSHSTSTCTGKLFHVVEPTLIEEKYGSGHEDYPNEHQQSGTRGEQPVFYGWGELSESDSFYASSERSRSSSQVTNNNDNDPRSQKMMALHTEFPDRQKFLNCNVSLSESDVSGSSSGDNENIKTRGKDEPFMATMQDEYDPRRPWRKAPMIELQSLSGQSDASALSSQSESTVFIGGVSSAHRRVDEISHATNINVAINDTGISNNADTDGFVDERPMLQVPVHDAGSDGKNSMKSCVSSELSELKIANEALQKSKAFLSNVDRSPTHRHQRQMSIFSESNFTLTTQVYRKPEPFRPGPGYGYGHSLGIGHQRHGSVNTLEKFYTNGSHQSIMSMGSTSISGSGSNTTPADPVHDSSSFQSLLSLVEKNGNSNATLPSIVENDERSNMNMMHLSSPMLPQHSRNIYKSPADNSNKAHVKFDGIENQLNHRPTIERDDSLVSALTMETMNEGGWEQYKRFMSQSSLTMGSRQSSGNNNNDGFKSKLSLNSNEENYRSKRSLNSYEDNYRSKRSLVSIEEKYVSKRSVSSNEDNHRSKRSMSSNDDSFKSKRSLGSNEESNRILSPSMGLGSILDLDKEEECLLGTTMNSTNLGREVDLNHLRETMNELHMTRTNSQEMRVLNVLDLQQVTRMQSNIRTSILMNGDDSMCNSLDTSDLNDNYSLADTSDAEDEHPSSRSRVSIRGSVGRLSVASTVGSVMRSRPLMRCRSCVQRKTAIIALVAIVIVAIGLAIFFLYIIPTASEIRRDRTEGSDGASSNNESDTVISPSPTMAVAVPLTSPRFKTPSSAPTRHVTFWPTPVDTYTKIYPPPGSA